MTLVPMVIRRDPRADYGLVDRIISARR